MDALEIVGIIVAVVGGLKAVEWLYGKLTNAHDRAQKWDEYEDKDKDINSKIQQIQAEQCMLTYCMMATLDGLHQLGCNGKVTEARTKLDKFINQQAHNQT